MKETGTALTGVQELINRLRDDGIKAGRQEADRLIHEARKQAAQIVAQAQEEAEALLTQAREQIQTERQAFQDAIRKAFRDTRLELAAQVRNAFTAHVRRLVSMELEDREFLRNCLLLIIYSASSNLPQDQLLEILVPQALFAPGPGGTTTLTETGQKELHQMVLGIAAETLRQGIVLQPSSELHSGLRIRLSGEDLEIDVSDRALGDLLLKYLLPRFQAIVQGVE